MRAQNVQAGMRTIAYAKAHVATLANLFLCFYLYTPAVQSEPLYCYVWGFPDINSGDKT